MKFDVVVQCAYSTLRGVEAISLNLKECKQMLREVIAEKDSPLERSPGRL